MADWRPHPPILDPCPAPAESSRPLLALAGGGSAAAQAAARDTARTGLGDITTTRQEIPRGARTGSGHMTAIRHDAPRVARTGFGDMNFPGAGVPRIAGTGRADDHAHVSQRVATRTSQRIPWLLIIAPLVLAATVAVHRGGALLRRAEVAPVLGRTVSIRVALRLEHTAVAAIAAYVRWTSVCDERRFSHHRARRG